MFSKKVALVAAIAVVAVIGTVCVFAPESTGLFRHGPVFKGPIDSAWAKWKADHNKTYGGPEAKARFAVFKRNYGKVQHHNALGKNFTLALNRFADLTNKEFAALYTGASTTMMNATNNCPPPSMMTSVSIPDTLDWRTQGRVGPVKDQGQCGSCWAFSTVGALEGLSATEGKIGNFAEQELVDCTTGYGNFGCGGGWVQNALAYVLKSGIANEADYTYTATDGDCQASKIARADLKINGCANVATNSVQALKEALQNGPVSIYVEADQSAFQLYSSGVVDDASCFAEGQIDHAVLLVGYTADAWIVKNSWASSWGDNGYLQIAMETTTDARGICGILSTPNTYPTL